MKILIVEDVVETRELVQTQLEMSGHEVTACPDAETALAAFQQAFYPLIIMDLGLPEMDGLELCWRIRSLPKGELSMILIITGYDDPELLHSVLDAGADDYLLKPISMKTLQIRVTIMEQGFHSRLRRRKVQEELLTYREQLEDLVEERTNELKRINIALQQEVAEHKQLKHSLHDSEERYRDLVESASDRKQAEEEPETSHSRLEEMINDHTAELKKANELLQQKILEQKQTETALRESEANLRAIFDSSRQSFMLIDPQYTIQALNHTAKQDARIVYGTEIEKGDRIDPGMFYGDPDSFNAHFQQALNGEFVNVEHKVKGKNNLPYWFVFQYNPVTTQSGQIIGVCLSVSDITSRKQMELNLMEAKDEAEGANKAKSEFLTNMSHELRTPLNIILGYTQILRQDSRLTLKHQHSVETIYRSGDHLLELVDDILDFSRLDVQKIELKPKDFSFSDFLAYIVETSRKQAQQKGITFHYEEMSELPEGIHADEIRLQQILQNLLDNAFKFTQQGKVVLQVGKKTAPDNSEKTQSSPEHRPGSPHVHLIRFQVEDTGIGIAPDQINKVFLPFYQIHTTWLPKAGTGLGLAISRKLIRMMHGDLHVESVEGQGSIFWYDLELPEAKGPVQPLTFPKTQYIIGIEGKKYTLLLVDDDDWNRKELQDMLVPLGFEVIEAVNGDEAIKKAKQYIPDLIMMDLVMPGMDGIEATRRLRWIPELDKTIILAISASAFTRTREESFIVGCDDFLTKPLHFDEILNKLQTHLGIKWVYKTASTPSPPEEEIDESPLIFPPAKDLEILAKFADFGNITGIQETLEQIKQADPKFLPFVSKITRMTDQFAFEKIIQFIKSH